MCETGWETTTDSLGYAEFRNLPRRSLSLHIYHGDPWISESRDPIQPDGQEIEVQLRRGFHVKGLVLGPDGEPLTYAVLRLSDGNGEDLQKVETDASGRFAVFLDPAHFPRLSISVTYRTDAGVLVASQDWLSPVDQEIELRSRVE